MIPIITGFLSKINKKIIIAVIMVLIVSIFIVLIAFKDSEIHKKEKEIGLRASGSNASKWDTVY